MGLPGHPGAARHHRYGGRAAAAGQALVGLPASSSSAAEKEAPQAAPRRARARVDRGARRRRDLPARLRAWRTPPSGTPGASPSAPPTTRWPGSRSARCVVHIAVKLPIIRGALDLPTSRTRRTTGRRRPSPASSPGAVCCAPPGSPPASPSSRPPAAPCRSCARCRSSASARATAPQDIPINKSAYGRRGAPAPRPSADYRFTVAHGDREVSLTRDELLAMEQTHATPCRSPASRGGARAAAGPASGSATCSTWSTCPGGSDVLVVSLQESGPYRQHDPAGQLRRRRPHPAGAGAERRAARDRPRLPGAADRARTGPACCRPSGSPGSRWRHEVADSGRSAS